MQEATEMASHDRDEGLDDTESLLAEETHRAAGSNARFIVRALVGIVALTAVAVIGQRALGGGNQLTSSEFGQVISLAACTYPGHDCRTSKKCCDPSNTRTHVCYEKNEHWADCKESCEPGTIDPNSPAEHQSNWTCKQLTPCAARGEDCLPSKCCQEAGHYCYKKSNFWAGCRPNCTAGELYEHDPPEHKRPWDCTFLDINTTSTTSPPATTTED